MNPRIKELLARPGLERLNDWVNIGPVQKATLEDFAELIIQECTNNIKEWCDASDEHTDKEEYWQGYQHGCDDSVAAIMEHFGVDE